MHMRRNTFLRIQEPGTGWASASCKGSKASPAPSAADVDPDRKFFGVWCEQQSSHLRQVHFNQFRKSTDKYNRAERDHGDQFSFAHSPDSGRYSHRFERFHSDRLDRADRATSFASIHEFPHAPGAEFPAPPGL